MRHKNIYPREIKCHQEEQTTIQTSFSLCLLVGALCWHPDPWASLPNSRGTFGWGLLLTVRFWDERCPRWLLCPRMSPIWPLRAPELCNISKQMPSLQSKQSRQIWKMDFLGRWQEARAKQVRQRWHGKRKASGLLKIEMSLGAGKSIQAMNLLVRADGKKHHSGAVGMVFFF